MTDAVGFVDDEYGEDFATPLATHHRHAERVSTSITFK
jgi:hypothetical protein